jgi:vacuolar-type H+-ATPase subunit H
MTVLELLEEIEDIADTSSGVPLTGKIWVDKGELLEIVKEIRVALPDEIQQAKWIKDERQRILDEAKNEYEIVVQEAKNQAKILTSESEIVSQARVRADELTRSTEANVKKLKMDTFQYIDKILFEFQGKMEQLNATYFSDMFTSLQKTFDGIGETVQGNRNEIKELAYRTQIEGE